MQPLCHRSQGRPIVPERRTGSLRVFPIALALAALCGGCGGPEPPPAQPTSAQPALAQPARADAPAASLDQLLAPAISAELGQPARAEIGRSTRAQGWILACGRPRRPDGTPIDYATTTLRELAAEGMVDDYFCALVADRADGLHMQELVVGSTDSPVSEWIETYGLPSSLLRD
jgi:hypothetical protein